MIRHLFGSLWDVVALPLLVGYVEHSGYVFLLTVDHVLEDEDDSNPEWTGSAGDNPSEAASEEHSPSSLDDMVREKE